MGIGLLETADGAPRAGFTGIVAAGRAPAGTDDAQFTAFYATYRPRLVRYLIGRYGPRDAEDLAEEVCLRALRAVDWDRSAPEIWSWLKLVASRLAIGLYRERLHCDVVADAPGVERDGSHEATAVDAETAVLAHLDAQCLRRALRALPPLQRRAIWLREVEGWPITLLAQALGLSCGATRQLLLRARRNLARHCQALLEPEEG